MATSFIGLANQHDLAMQSSEFDWRTEQVISLLTDAETGQRGYLLGGDAAYLKRFRSAEARLDASLASMAALSREILTNRDPIDELTRLAGEKMAELRLTIRLRDEEGGDAALAVVKTDRGRRTMDRARQVAAEIHAEADGLLRERIRSKDRLQLIVPAVMTFATAISLGLILRARRRHLAEIEEGHQAVRRSEAWLFTTLASIGDAVIATDDQGMVRFINPVACALTGWTTEDALGRPIAEVCHLIAEESRQPIANPCIEVMRVGVILKLPVRTLLVARDKTERPIEDSATPIRRGRGHVSGSVIIFRDISERRSNEKLISGLNERLSRRVNELQTILDTAPVGISVAHNPDGKVITSNRALADMLGMPVGHNVSMTRDDGEPLPYRVLGDGREIPIDQLPMRRATRGIEVAGEEVEIVRADGTILTVLVHAIPTRDDAGRILGAVEICVDITAQIRAQEGLAEAARRKDTYLAMLAHELRNPLASISSAVELLGRHDTGEDRSWALEVLGRQADHLTRLIDDLLDVSRFSRGKIELRKETIELASIVRNSAESVKHLMTARGHHLEVSLPGEAVWLEVDLVRVEQILTNLLGNAAKYTEDGGRIRLTAIREDDVVVIRVIDSGIGIAPALLPSVFEPFIQAERSPARSEGGLGIGLTIARSLAELHGGTISAQSAGPGMGSEFAIRLPSVVGPHQAPAFLEAPAESSRPASLVLIVDDNVDLARSFSRLLKMRGYDVRLAHDGMEGLEAARVLRPDIILLDIGLPSMDGYEVARQIRAEEFGQAIRIIAVTGYGGDEDRTMTRAAGFDLHLAKPVDMKILLNSLSVA